MLGVGCRVRAEAGCWVKDVGCSRFHPKSPAREFAVVVGDCAKLRCWWECEFAAVVGGSVVVMVEVVECDYAVVVGKSLVVMEFYCAMVVGELGPVDPSFRALSGRLKFYGPTS